MSNETTTPEYTYVRKVGIFGHAKNLGVTVISGTTSVVADLATLASNTTGSAVLVSAVAHKAVDIWGKDLIEDLENDSVVNRMHRELDQLQQSHHLEALRAQLAKAKATAVRAVKTGVPQ
jgi:hypothetical protein